ncbi:MAG: DUF3617 family protein [Pseudomonadota bacterium]
MRALLVIALAAPALIALQQAPGAVALTDASPEQVADAVKAVGGTGMRPGKWESRIQHLNADGTDSIAWPYRPTVVTDCELPLDPHRPAPDEPIQCRYRSYTLSPGRIDATLACSAAEDRIVTRFAGTFERERYAMESEVTVTWQAGTPRAEPAAPQAPGRSRVTGRWLGECDKDDGKK